MDTINKLNDLVNSLNIITREDSITTSIENLEAFVTSTGALATWNKQNSTGRSPKDTYLVKREEVKEQIDWSSPANIPMSLETFDELLEYGYDHFEKSEKKYKTYRSVGADPKYSLNVNTVSDKAIVSSFTYNMFRDINDDNNESLFKEDFTLLILPELKVTKDQFPELRDEAEMVIATDLVRNIGIVLGSSYLGSIKKLIFTSLNYILPEYGVLPLHCGANKSRDNSALFLGLSGTGKTTLSTDTDRPLIGDDEHGWSESGIFNLEGGSYAKLIDLNPEKEPEIYEATFTTRAAKDNGVIIENAFMLPNREFDLSDSRLTPNSRASYPLNYLRNTDRASRGDHPETIFFLTADANGVLPPIAKLNDKQAMFWFMMGYTSKLAGTENGIKEPKSDFSRFFGAPFMPRNPKDYTILLKEKLNEHGTKVYLINTGWVGGPYGVGSRIDINITRTLINSALDGSIEHVDYRKDQLFKLSVPISVAGLDLEDILNPESAWSDPNEYKARAKQLSQDFQDHFDKAFSNSNIDPEIANQCPGR